MLVNLKRTSLSCWRMVYKGMRFYFNEEVREVIFGPITVFNPPVLLITSFCFCYNFDLVGIILLDGDI